MRKVKDKSEIEKWPLFIDGTCQQETNKNDTGAPADWNDPCTKASAAAELTLRRSSSQTSPIISILSIVMVIVQVFELKSHEFDDFNDETNGFNNGFELEYELQYEFECDALSSPTNKSTGVLQYTSISEFGVTPTGGSSSQAIVFGHDLVTVLPATTASTIPITNTHNMKYDTSPTWTHADTHLTPQPTASITDRIFSLDLIGAVSRDFNDLECQVGVALSENEFKHDMHNVLKHYLNENFDNNGYCNTYYRESAGMYVFDFFDTCFLANTLFMHPAAHKLAFALFCFIKETLKADTLFILLMGCVIGLKLCESCVFGNEIIVCNSDFELKYEWKYELG